MNTQNAGQAAEQQENQSEAQQENTQDVEATKPLENENMEDDKEEKDNTEVE